MMRYANKYYVSVIIPVRNEYLYIEKCLSQLVKQTYPKERFEVLVIDGMSTDGTREVIGRFKTQGLETEVKGERLETKSYEMPTIRLVNNPRGQRASALNIGIREAKGDIVMRIDGRTVVPSDYMEKCVRTLLETEADNVGGVLKPLAGSTTQEATGIALTCPFGVGNSWYRIGSKSGFVDTLYLFCSWKNLLERVGLFDEESSVISEDSDINQRIREAGGKVYLNKDIVAYYYPRNNFKDLWKLYFRYGGAKAGNLIKRRKLTAWRQVVPPAFLFILVILPILGIFNKLSFYLWLLITGSYIIADAVVSLYLSFKYRSVDLKSSALNKEHRTSNIERSKLSLFWRLFMVFPTMHFSWALGFWRRLLQRPKAGEYWGY